MGLLFLVIFNPLWRYFSFDNYFQLGLTVCKRTYKQNRNNEIHNEVKMTLKTLNVI